MPPRDYYAMLRLRPEATAEEIKRSYRKLALELHPAITDDPDAQQRFRGV